MAAPALTIEEQHNIDNGSWFAKLSALLRRDILDRSTVRRARDGAQLGTRGATTLLMVGRSDFRQWLATHVELYDALLRGLALAQEDLSQLLGASRQRVNQEHKALERQGALRVEPTRLVILARDKLLALSESA